MEWPHTITLKRPNVTKGEGGKPIVGEPTIYYNEKCDSQENSRQQDVSSRIETTRGSATVFMPVKVEQLGVQENDLAEICYPNSTRTGTVNRVDGTEDSLLVLYD